VTTKTLPWTENGKVLVHGPGGIQLLSNTCRHRQGLLLEGRGHVNNIVCPLHRWTYDLNGTLLGAPTSIARPTVRCRSPPCRTGMDCCSPGRARRQPISRIFRLPAITIFNFVFDRMLVEECPFIGKTFSRSISSSITSKPRTRACRNGSIRQLRVGLRRALELPDPRHQGRAALAASPNYTRYRDALLAYSGGALPAYGTVWSILYPNVMLEWYPHCLVISTLIPRSPDHTTNIVEFYYPEEIKAFEPADRRRASGGLCGICCRGRARCASSCHRGRKALWLAGVDVSGPFTHRAGRHFTMTIATRLSMAVRRIRVQGSPSVR